jgi:hypothetical protein
MGLLESQLEGPEAVIDYMSGALSDSIGDWDSLNTFQKEAVANAAGMNMEQMNHLMNQKNMTKEEKARAESLADTMAAGRDLWQEMTIFAQNFAIAVTPVVNFLVDGFQLINAGLAQISETLGPFMNILKIAAGLWAGMFAIGGIMKAVSALKTLTAGIYKEIAARITLNAMKGPLGWGVLAAGGIIAAGAYSKYVKGRDKHAKGTDNTSGRMALVGEEGPELLVPPPHSAVVNNSTMTDLAKQATNRSVAGQGSNSEMAASIASLKDAMKEMSNRPIEVTTNPVMLKDDLGRGVNDHFGEPGSRPIRLRTA